jgi:hypothetical protein
MNNAALCPTVIAAAGVLGRGKVQQHACMLTLLPSVAGWPSLEAMTERPLALLGSSCSTPA